MTLCFLSQILVSVLLYSYLFATDVESELSPLRCLDGSFSNGDRRRPTDATPTEEATVEISQVPQILCDRSGRGAVSCR